MRIRLPGATNLNDGDVVTLIGKRGADGFSGYVLRNETTSTVHSFATWQAYLLGLLLLAIGIPFSLILIGLPLLGIGIYVLWIAVRQTRALKLLGTTPKATVAAE